MRLFVKNRLIYLIITEFVHAQVSFTNHHSWCNLFHEIFFRKYAQMIRLRNSFFKFCKNNSKSKNKKLNPICGSMVIVTSSSKKHRVKQKCYEVSRVNHQLQDLLLLLTSLMVQSTNCCQEYRRNLKNSFNHISPLIWIDEVTRITPIYAKFHERLGLISNFLKAVSVFFKIF